MILPTYVGHDEIWCGGEQVFFSPTKSVDGYGLTAVTVVQYSIDQLTAHTSPCSLQGTLALHPSSFSDSMFHLCKAAMLLFGFLASIHWWAIISFNMCLEVKVALALKQRKNLNVTFIYSYTIDVLDIMAGFTGESIQMGQNRNLSICRLGSAFPIYGHYHRC